MIIDLRRAGTDIARQSMVKIISASLIHSDSVATRFESGRSPIYALLVIFFG